MSKNISVKINSGNETVETVKLNAANKKVIIKAQPNVNYELVDDNTQYAPETIDTKRIGNDLHIAFEGTDINQESDLVLEGYYESNNTELLLGKAENGQYYAYVPQSGVESDAVTLLAEEVFSPQALGGNSVATPFWAFNPNWLWVAAGVVAVGGIIAAANDSGKASGGTDTTAPAKPTVEAKDNGSVEVTPPADADTKSVEVGYTDEAGTPKTATLTKGDDGNWTSNNPDVAVDPATGKATIPADKVKDGSPVTAKATDNAGNTGEEGTANAGNNPDTTAPAKPTVEAKDNGSVEVTPPADADTKSVEVGYTDEAGTPKTATLTKGDDGNWTSNNPDVAVDPATGKATIPADKVKDGSPVTAKATDNAGNTGEEGTANAGNNPDTTAPAKPTVEAKDNGSVEVTPPADADTKSVEVGYTDEAGTPKTATLTKGDDGNWTSNNPDVAVDPATGKATIPADKVKDGSPVTAKATDNAGNTGEEGTVNAGNNPDTTAPSAPEVTPSTTDGSVAVKVPGDAQVGDTVEVTVTPEGSDTPEKVTLTKQADGSWTSDKPETVPSVEAGKDSTTIPQDKVKDGSEVTAQAKDPSGNESTPVKANAGNNAAAPDTTAPAKPTVEAKDNGSVEVTPPADADTKSVEVGYTDEAGTPKTATLTKGEDGNWTSNNPDVAVDPATGKATIPADKVKDGSPVTAKATDNAGNTGEEGTANAGNNPDTTAPAKPTVEAKDNGSVEVTPPADADTKSVEVGYTDEAGTPKTATLTKGDDGNWTSNNPDVAVDPATGKATIPADKVKDGSPVTAKATDNAGNTGEEGTANAGNNPDTTAPAKPTVEAKDNGSVEVTPPADADTKSVEVGYTDEAGTPKTATLTKGDDGNWTSNNPDVAVDPATGKATIPADKVKDGSPVTAKATDNAGNTGEEGTANAGNNPDTTAPAKPTVEAKDNGSVEVTPPADADTKSVEVGYTDEAGTPKTATLTKGDDGNWTSNNPDVAVDPATGKATIPADKVKDGSPVTAKATDNAGNTGEEGTANAGNNPDTTAPAKPTVEAKDNGSVEVTPPADADTKSVEVGYTDEAGTPKTATLTKGDDGNWTSNNPDVAVDPATGKATIPADKVKDGSPVTAKATDNAGNTGEEGTANAGNNPDTTAPAKPTVEAKDNGSVEVTPPADADTKSVEVGYTDEAGTPKTATLTKGEDGTWTSNNPDVAVDPATGKATIPADKVKDGSPVTAKATDTAGNAGEEGTVNAGNNPDTTAPSAPEVTPSTTDGSVTVKVPGDAQAGDTVEVTVTPEGSDTPEKVTLTKQADGSWTSDKPETVPSVEAGKDSTTIPQDKVKDGSEVTAQAKDPSGNESTPVKANAGNNAAAPDTTAPAKPTVEAKDNGSVEVTPPADADTKSVEVGYTDEAGTPKTATLTKGEDGNWTSNNPDVAVDPATGKATIPADKVKDGSPVTAKATDTAGNTGEEGTVNAGNNPDTTAPSAPEVTPSTTDGSVAVKVPGDAQVGDTVEVTVTPEGSDTPEKVTLTKQADGSWTSDKPETVPSVEAGKDSTTIPQDKVKDGSEVTAQAKDPSGNESTPVKANAGNNAAAPDTTAPAKPTVEAKDNGSVEVTPPADADTKSVEVGYTDEAGTPKTATLTKGEDGNWTSNNPDVAVDPATGKATIPADKVKDGSPVTAKATDNAGNTGEEGTANAGNNPDTTAPAKPTVEAKDNGSVEVTPPADADTKSVEVGYTDEAGTPKTATLTKGDDGNWTSNNPDVAVDPATGKATIPADKVKDGSPVTAKATDNAGNTGEEGTANAGNNPDTTAPAKPTVEAKDNGSVEVTPPADADTKSVEVGYTDEAGTPKTATLTKGDDGNWTSNNPDVAVDPATGKATIPADKVKDGSPVTAKATDNAGNTGEEGTANAGNNPDTTAPAKPTVEAKDNGSVEVTPPADADTKSVEVGYTDEAGTPKTATLTKGEDGTWTSNNPDVAVDPATGKATIPADKVKDGSPVTAKATDTAGNAGEEGTVNAGNNPDTTAPSAPEVTPSTTDGSVTVKVPGDAQAGDTVEVTVTPEGSDTPEKVTLTKQADGSWTSDKPETVPSVEAGKDSTTIPQDKVKDGSEVTAQAKDPSGNESTPVKANAGNNAAAPDTTAPAKPTVEAKDNGSVEVTPPADADTKSVEVGYTDEAGTPKTATLTKGEDGNWTSNNPDVAVDPATGKATIPADKVKDGSPVTAKATDTAGNTGEEGTVNAGNNPDTTAPAKPTVEAKDNGSVEVTPPADADTKSVEVGYTDEAGTPKTATLTKGDDGNWTSNNPDVAVDPATGKATIPADKVKDGSPVTAKATDNAGNTGEEGTANAGNNPDTTAPAKPTVEAKDNGSVEVTPPADADTKSVEVGYTDEAGTPKTATLTKGDDGNWTSNNPDVAVDPATGKATIPADKVKDGSPVTAKATDNAGNTGEEGTANAGNNPDTTAPAKPTVEAKDNGSVEVTPPADADTKSVEVGYTDEAGTPKTATLTKGDDGNWTSNNPDVAVDPATGKATIPADKVKDGSPVTAKATDNAGNTGEEGTANAGNNPDTTAPAKPTVEAKDNGSVEVTPPADADTKSVEVGYTDEAGTPKTATLTKGDDGNWTSNNPDVAVDPATGKATIPADKVKDGSPVTAKATDNAGNTGEEGTANAGNNPDTTAPAKPTVEAKDNGSVEVTPPADADTKSVEVGYTDEAGTPKTATLTKGEDGTWTSNNPDVAVDPATGKATIPADKVKDGSPVTAKATDTAGNAGEEGTVNAGNNPDTTAPSAPEVTPSTTDGSVTVKVPGDAQAGDTVEVTVTPEGSDTPEKVTLTKQADGSWTSDKPETVPSVEAGKDSTTIPQDKVKDGSEVTAQAKDPSGNESTPVKANAGNNAAAPDTTAPAKPTVEAKDNGSVEVTPPADADTKSVEVGYTDEAGTPKTATLTKGEDGNWTSNNPDVAVDPATGKATIPADKVKDGSPVTAKATDNAGNTGEEGTANAGNNPDTTAPAKPTVEAKDNGSVEVTPPADADTKSVEVGYTDEAGTPKTATLTKGDDGNWTSNNPDVAVDPATGKATIPADKVKDGSPVTAKATDNAGNTGEEGTANAGNNPDTTAPAKPTVEAKDNGSVEVTPPADADTKSVEVGYTDEAGTPKTATLTKGDDGNWTSNNPDVAVDPATGKATIPADKVKDGSPVTAKATDTAGNAGEEGTANAGNNPDTTAPSAPEVTPSTTDGSVAVKVPGDAQAGDTVEVTVTPEGSDTPEKVTLTKQADGSWTSDKPETVPNVEAGKDSTTIPQDKVKDGSEVTAQAKDPSGNDSAPITAQAGENADKTAPGKPTIEAKINGTVEITPPADEDTKSVEVNYIDEEGNPQTVTIIKDANEGWIPSEPFDLLTNPDVILPDSETGKITLPADKVKDGSLVKASATDNAGNKGEEATEHAVSNPDLPPGMPEAEALEDRSVRVTMPNDAEVGDFVVIERRIYKGDGFEPDTEASAETLATLTKQQDGSWISDKPENVPSVDVGNNTTIIPANKLKGFADVHVQAKDPAGNESAVPLVYLSPEMPEVTAKTDGSVEITPPAAPYVKSMKVRYIDEAGKPKTATLTKGEDGTWTSDNPDVVVESATGKATIPADKVQDGSEVGANAANGRGVGSRESKANAGNNPDTTAPDKPTVEAKDNGSVEVTPPADEDTKSVEVSYTDEAGTPKTVTITKGTDGTWTSNNPDVAVEPATGKATIPADKVQDGSPVKAKATDNAGNISNEGTANAGNNPDTTAPSAPEVTPSTEDGSVTVKVPSDAEAGDTVEVTVTPEGSDTPEKVTLTKQTDGSWTSSNPTTLPNVEAGQSSTTIPQDKVKDGSPVTAQAKDPAGNESAVVSQPAGNNKVVKLELSLAQDTGASNNDNYTRNGQVNVSGIPSGSEWEYSTDGGQTWNSGSGNSFTLPNNTKVGGIAYSLQARVKGNAASASDTLNMTLDQKAGEFHAIIDGSMNLIGTAEKNSTISINNRSGKANANGEFEFATGIASGATAKKVHYSVVETDLAGNSVSKDVAYTYYRRVAGGSHETYGNENDVILIGTKGGTGDLGALIRSSLTTGSGDDSVYATGVQYRSNTLDMGDGNDFASFQNIAGTINMGAGNDILEARQTGNGFFYLAGGNPTINMGAGDDIVRTSSTINTRASIDGGSDFDTLQFVNRDGKAITTTISMISNFEKIDITGTSNNSVTISASDVDRNHSAKATVDASGKSHNNVLIVDGDAGDKVTLSGISKAASSQVTHEGNTYNVYNTGSNELWVDSDITIA